MQNYKKLISKVSTVAAGLALPVLTLAADPFTDAKTSLNTVTQKALGTSGAPKPIYEVAGNIINVALGFIGIVLLGYLLYSGYLWMTAGGEDKKVEEARKQIKNAIIGLIILLASFAITDFVLTKLTTIVR